MIHILCSYSYGTDYLLMKWDDVNCASSSYLSIAQCSYSTYIDSGCTNSNSYDATVYCCKLNNKLIKIFLLIVFTSDFTRIWDTPFSGMMRLRGGTFTNQGLVEVYCNGQWGTLCNADFDSSDVTTLCNKLGYDDYSNYSHLAM